MKVVILAGGLGTRLQEETTVKPKPMVEIGGRPILWHIMQIYAAAGFREFVVALGYRGDVIKRFFIDYRLSRSDISIDLGAGVTTFHEHADVDWKIDLVDTGSRTETGGRVKRLAPIIGSETFMMTYGDGVSDLDINNVVSFHRSHGKLATVTGVRPPARFGALTLEGDRVVAFAEKPHASEGWVSGGFFVLAPQVLDYITGDDTLFEREPLERLARDGELMVYRHSGFWQGMDTLRDVRHLEALWQSRKAPWRAEYSE